MTFEIGQIDVQPLVADGCDACHQNDSGEGYVQDLARYNKILSDDAIDQCGASTTAPA